MGLLICGGGGGGSGRAAEDRAEVPQHDAKENWGAAWPAPPPWGTSEPGGCGSRVGSRGGSHGDVAAFRATQRAQCSTARRWPLQASFLDTFLAARLAFFSALISERHSLTNLTRLLNSLRCGGWECEAVRGGQDTRVTDDWPDDSRHCPSDLKLARGASAWPPLGCCPRRRAGPRPR